MSNPKKILNDGQFTISHFKIRLSHPVDMHMEEVGARLAKSIDVDSELNPMSIETEANIYDHVCGTTNGGFGS